MIETAENVGREYGISREEQDEWAVRSHTRAVAAMEAGLFDDETIPVTVPQRKGDPLTITRDEHPRPGTTAESLAKLTPMMARVRPDATVTAGNSSGQNDAAAVAIVTTPARQRPSDSARWRAWSPGRWQVSSRGSWGSGRSPPPRRR